LDHRGKKQPVLPENFHKIICGKRCNTLEPEVIMAHLLTKLTPQHSTPSKKRTPAMAAKDIDDSKELRRLAGGVFDNDIFEANGFKKAVAGGAVVGGAGGKLVAALARGADSSDDDIRIELNVLAGPADPSDDEDDIGESFTDIGNLLARTNLADAMGLATDVVLADNVEAEGDKKA
jgi:hypothetical protein